MWPWPWNYRPGFCARHIMHGQYFCRVISTSNEEWQNYGPFTKKDPISELWSLSLTLTVELKTWIKRKNHCLIKIRGSCKTFCNWVRITSVLRFSKHIFITNRQNIPPSFKHSFVTFLPIREKQINSLLLVSVGDTVKQRCQENFQTYTYFQTFFKSQKRLNNLTHERRRGRVKGWLVTILCLVVSYCKTLSHSSVQNSCRIGQWLYDQMDKALERLAHLN